MLITWQFEVRKIDVDDTETMFREQRINAETIREAVKEAQNIIQEMRINLFPHPIQSGAWVLNDEENRIWTTYTQRDTHSGSSSPYDRPKFCTTIKPLNVCLQDISDYSEKMLFEGIRV